VGVVDVEAADRGPTGVVIVMAILAQVGRPYSFFKRRPEGAAPL